MIYLREEDTMNSCHGCGAILQTDEKEKEGYTTSLENRFCERCFRIKNYNEYQKSTKGKEVFLENLKTIEPSHLMVLVVDLFQIPKNLEEITTLFSNPILLVLTKRDLLPVSLYEEKLKNYFLEESKQIVDTVIISSSRNYHFDELMEKIRKYQTSKEVYVIGYTNAGKSSMINRILLDYTQKIPEITTSMLPRTTLENLEIEIDSHFTLIDTPGLLDEKSLLVHLEEKDLKKVMPKKMIRPLSYQVKEPQWIYLDRYGVVECPEENDLIFYFSNTLEMTRYRKNKEIPKDFVKHSFSMQGREDVVIDGLGFIKVMRPGNLIIYTYPEVDVYVRKSLI